MSRASDLQARARARVGVLGAGQLALMLAEAAQRLDAEVICAGAPGDCAERVATVLDVDLADARKVAAFGRHVDVVTIESENIDADVLAGLRLRPNAEAVRTAQDRWLEKNFLRGCGMDVAPFARVDSAGDLHAALREIGLPAILKTRRLGYDGKGQVRLQAAAEAEAAWEAVGGVPSILEGMLDFDAEASLVAARSASGEVAFYPLTANLHRAGILRRSDAPFDGAAGLQAIAEGYLRTLLDRLEYVGVLAVEFFLCGGRLVANEMAPRVHNSGHWTIEGAATSQFANHLLALLDRPLGSTLSRPTVMLNCIGRMPPASETARWPELARHDYGKEPREGRKVGHLTFPAEARQAIAHWEDWLRRESWG